MSVTTGFQTLKLEQLHESPLNPRKTFDKAQLDELAASIRTSGIITPLIVRPNAKGFEIAAGHRRYRAAKIAGLDEAPTIVREMSDAEFVEVLNVENLQRQDLSPLEEAEGYRTLMTKAGYDVTRIAERVGRSQKYVYDRVKLLQLIEPAQQLLRDGTITAGHAILLARLKPEDQKRAISPHTGGLLEHEELLWAPTDHVKPSVKARSVRELEGWIDRHVRFDAKADAVDPVLFPETAQVLADVKPKEKVIQITYEHYVQEEARSEERTLGPRSWKQADGKGKSKTCEHSVIGVIVVGPGRGEAFKVCTAREKCKVHWAAEQRERAQRAKSDGGGGGAASRQAERERYEDERAKREAKEKLMKAAVPAIYTALAKRVAAAPAGVNGPLGKVLLGGSSSRISGEYISPGTSAEDLVRYLAFEECARYADTWNGLKNLTAAVKPLGVDVAKIVAAVATKTEADKPAVKAPKPATSAKKGTKK